jgi:hypothetical protein
MVLKKCPHFFSKLFACNVHVCVIMGYRNHGRLNFHVSINLRVLGLLGVALTTVDAFFWLFWTNRLTYTVVISPGAKAVTFVLVHK